MKTEQLELKHIVGYLTYKLKVYRDNKSLPSEIFTIVGATEENVFTQQNGLALVSFDRIKPILRPLSDLTKPITHNGETFVPIEKIYQLMGWELDELPELIERGDILGIYSDEDLIPYSHATNMYRWHFDIHRLIEKNLAININTL